MNFHRPLISAVVVLLLLCSAQLARADHGFESAIQIRLLEKQTFVIVRITPSALGAFLGDERPAEWTERSVAALEPRLQEIARTLLVVRSGGQTLEPARINVSLEVGGLVALVLRYPPAATGPFSADAIYFRKAGPAFTGSLTIYGPPENPSERHGAELGTLELSARQHLLQVSRPALAAPAAPVAPVAPASSP